MEKMMMITRRKAKSKSKDDDDEEVMTLIKAAAWAWFQHGSGSIGKSFQEFQLTRPEKLVITPSRFKLEARRQVMEINNNDSLSESSESEYLSLTLSPAQTDNSLLDTYEIEQISRQLDILIESSSNNTRHRRSSFVSDRGHKKNLPLPPPPRTSPGNEKKLRKNPKKLNGSWLMYGAVCSSIEGVVEPRSLGAVCRSIEGVVEPGLLNRPGRRMNGPSNHQRKAHYK